MFPVYYFSVEQVAKLAGITVEQAETHAYSVGGFCAMIIKDKSLEEYYKTFGINEKYSIIVSSTVIKKAKMNEKEVQAILAHEEAHFVLCHLDDTEIGIMNNNDREIEADMYAIEKLGKEYRKHLRQGLIKIIRTCFPDANWKKIPDIVERIRNTF